MARKNGNRHFRAKLPINKGHHFIYQIDETSNDATVVRYLGEQDGHYLYCWHPEGYALWIHIAQLHNRPRVKM